MADLLKSMFIRFFLPFDEPNMLNFDNWLYRTNPISEELLIGLCQSNSVIQAGEKKSSEQTQPVDTKHKPLWQNSAMMPESGKSFFLHISLKSGQHDKPAEAAHKRWFELEPALQSLPFRFTDIIMVKNYDCSKLFPLRGIPELVELNDGVKKAPPLTRNAIASAG